MDWLSLKGFRFKVEYGNVVNLYRIIPSLEGSLYKYSFSFIKNEPKAIDGLLVDNDYEDDMNDMDDDDDMDADTGTYYPHSNSKDSTKHQRSSHPYGRREQEPSENGDSTTGQRQRQHPTQPHVSIYNQVYEKIPFDIDDLLKSTFLFNNDLTFTGSIHSNLIQVDNVHGKVSNTPSIFI